MKETPKGIIRALVIVALLAYVFIFLIWHRSLPPDAQNRFGLWLGALCILIGVPMFVLVIRLRLVSTLFTPFTTLPLAGIALVCWAVGLEALGVAFGTVAFLFQFVGSIGRMAGMISTK